MLLIGFDDSIFVETTKVFTGFGEYFNVFKG